MGSNQAATFCWNCQRLVLVFKSVHALHALQFLLHHITLTFTKMAIHDTYDLISPIHLRLQYNRNGAMWGQNQGADKYSSSTENKL